MAEILFSFDVFLCVCVQRIGQTSQQESRAVARKPRDAAAVLFGLKFADNIHCKQASKAMLQSSNSGARQN